MLKINRVEQEIEDQFSRGKRFAYNGINEGKDVLSYYDQMELVGLMIREQDGIDKSDWLIEGPLFADIIDACSNMLMNDNQETREDLINLIQKQAVLYKTKAIDWLLEKCEMEANMWVSNDTTQNYGYGEE